MSDRLSLFARCRKQVSDADLKDIIASLRINALAGDSAAARLIFDILCHRFAAPDRPRGNRSDLPPDPAVRSHKAKPPPGPLPRPNGTRSPPVPVQRPLPTRPEIDQDLRSLVGLVATLGPRKVKQLAQASGLGLEAVEGIVRGSGCFAYSHDGLWVLSAKGEELVRDGKEDR